MFKKILLMVIGLGLAAGVFAAESTDIRDMKYTPRGWSPFRLCFTKGAIAFPEKPDVYGINIGIPESFNYNGVQKIYGIDFGFIAADAKADGLQLALTNWSKGTDGVQAAFANLVEDFTGVQIAIANYVKKSYAVQFGLFNFSRQKSKGFQLGVLNFMDEGFLPFCPIINFSW